MVSIPLYVRGGEVAAHTRIDVDRLDNQRANLRVATRAQNNQNQPARGGSSKFRGVTWVAARGKWQAQAVLSGRNHFLGRFDSEDEAAAAASAFRTANMPFAVEAV